MNSVVHLGTCIVLGVGPHVAYYHGTPLVDNSTLRSCVHGFVASMLTEIGKLVFLASLISGFDSVEHDVLKTLLHVVVGFLDIPGMWFAVTGITHRNMSTEDKFQSIALGWAMGDTITNRLAPIFLGCLLGDFHWRPLQLALQSNVKLVHALSFAAVACLMWSKRSKPGTLMVLLHLSAAAHSALPFPLGALKGDSPLTWAVLAAELLVSLLLALSSWGLYRQAGMKHA